jgi:DNA processing protein
MRADLPYWLALARFPAFGAVRLGRLCENFGDMKEAFEADAEALMAAGIENKHALQFVSERATLDPDAELQKTIAGGLRAVTRLDDEYPEALKEIHDPPAVLFVRGNFPDSNRPHLAVVGSRHPTPYGIRATQRLIEPLAAAGVVIVSGLAYGIDAAAHEAAIAVGGTTLAVLGCGADEASVYPSRHRLLARRVQESGVVMSERPVGTPALKQYFPARNRVIAGLCRATLVVEAAKDSGSLITAQCALEENRDVAIVPGPIESPMSEGPHKLLRNGAAAITSPEDLFELLGLIAPSRPKQEALLELIGDEKTLFETLTQEPVHMDDLARRTGLPSHAVSAAVTTLELKGAARHVGGKHYVRA